MQVQTLASSKQSGQTLTMKGYQCVAHMLCYHRPMPHHAGIAGVAVRGKTPSSLGTRAVLVRHATPFPQYIEGTLGL